MISSRLYSLSILHIRLFLFLLCVQIGLLHVVSQVGSSRSSLGETFIDDSGKTGLAYVGQGGKVIQLIALLSRVKAFPKKIDIQKASVIHYILPLDYPTSMPVLLSVISKMP